MPLFFIMIDVVSPLKNIIINLKKNRKPTIIIFTNNRVKTFMLSVLEHSRLTPFNSIISEDYYGGLSVLFEIYYDIFKGGDTTSIIIKNKGIYGLKF